MPSLADLRQRLPQLQGFDDQDAVSFIQQAYYPGRSTDEVASALGVRPMATPTEPSGFARRAFGDTGVSLLKGAIAVPEALVGVADLATGGRAGQVAESIGFRPKEAKAIVDEWYSPEQQAANREVQQAQGFTDTALAALRNPSTILQAAVESAPSLLPAGAVARGARALMPGLGGAVAAGIGEGVVSAGATAEQVRQQTADGLLTGEQSALAAGSGALTGAIGAVAGKIANRLGIGDVNQLVAGVQEVGPAAQKSFARALLEGFATEGVLQELPQSAQEQIAQNVALGRPWDEGVGNAAAMGALAGGLVGGAVAPFGRAPSAEESMQKLASATTVSDMITSAAELANAPLDVPAPKAAGLDADQENRALTAMERQMQADHQAIKFGGPRESGPTAPVPLPRTPSGIPAEASAEFVDSPPLLDRLATLNEQLGTPEVRETIRAKLGDEAMSTVLYYLQQANRPGGADGIPETTRNRIVDLAETIVSRALLQPTATASGQPAIAPQAFGTEALTGTPAPATPQLGMAAGRTGTVRVDARGNAVPETRVDAINTRQAVQSQQQAREAAAAEASAIEPQARRASAVYGDGLPKRPAAPTPQPQRTRTDAVDLALPGAQQVDPVVEYVDRLRTVSTPQARAFVQDFNAGRITRRDVIRVMQSQGQDPLTADQRLAKAAAQAPGAQPQGIQPAQVYRSRTKATIEARKVGGEVVPVQGGFQVQEAGDARPDAAGDGGRGAVDLGAGDGTGVLAERAGRPGPAGGTVRDAYKGVAAGNDGRGSIGALITVDTAANEAATSPANDLAEPTQAQKEAGNYRLGHTRVAGLDISIENPQGSVRRGIDRDGKAWENTLQHHYGYIKGTEGSDGDQVDVFVKPGTASDFAGRVFVVDQVDPATGKHDEHKALIGFDTEQEARDAYQANYAKGWKGLKSITAMPVEEFKAWVRDPKKTGRPLTKVSEQAQPGGTLAEGAGGSRPAPAPTNADSGIEVKAGKGLIKGKFLADLDGEGVPGGPWATEAQAVLAAEAWKQRKIENAKSTDAERQRWDAIAAKISAGRSPSDAELQYLGLKPGSSDVRWFFPIAARLFGVTSRSIRPMVKDMVRVGHTDMGAKREFVPTAKALKAIASQLEAERTTADESKASRKADPGRAALRWTRTDRNAAGPEFYGRDVDLIALRQFDLADEFSDDALPLGHTASVRDGNTAHQFMVVDHDGGMLGMASLEVNPAGEIEAIHDIEITDKRAGTGRQVVSAILANASGPVRIIDILDQADAFWQRMGAGYKDTYGNATADWASYRAQGQDARAGEGRGPRTGQELEAGRPAAGEYEGSEGSGHQEVGPKANRFAELLRGSSGKGLPIRLAEMYARSYEAAGLHRVNVARNFDDLPSALRAKLSGFGDDVRGAYFPGTDQIYVFTENIATPDELHFVVMHEAFHRGLGALFGPQGRRLLRQMYASNQRLRERADLVASELGISRDEAIEEALADMAGEGKAQNLRGWRKLASLIRGWLRSMAQRVGMPMRFSDAQIEAFAAGVSRAGINRDPAAQGEADGLDSPRVTTGAELAAASRGTTPAVPVFDNASGNFNPDLDPYWIKQGKKEIGDGLSDADFNTAVAEYANAWRIDELLQKLGWTRRGSSNVSSSLYFVKDVEVAPYEDDYGNESTEKRLEIRVSDHEDRHPNTDPEIAQRININFRDGTAQWSDADLGPNLSTAELLARIESLTNEPSASGRSDASVRFSRAPMSMVNQQAIRDALADRFKSAGEQVNWWQKTVGTQYDKAKAHSEYGKVFNHVQQYIEDTSTLANEAADQAPAILPKLESVRDVFAAGKRGLSTADEKAVAAPIFEGTLNWARRGGKVVKFDDLQAQAEQMTTDEKARELLHDGKVSEAELKRWQATPLDIYDGAVRNRYAAEYLQPGVVFTRDELQTLFKLTDAQVLQYEQFRAAVGESLDQVAAADALRLLGDVTPEIRAAAMGNRANFRGAVEAHLQDRIKQETDSDKRDALQNTLADIVEKFDKVDALKARGYAPLMRFGKFFVSVKGQDGEQEFFGLYETRAEANRMARELRQDPDYTGRVEQGTMSQEAFKLFSGIPVESLEMFADAIGAENSAVYQEWLRLTKNNRSALKRLIKRKGTEGFSDQVTRVLASFVTSNARLAAGAMNLPQAKEAAESIRAGDVKDEGVKLIEAVQNPVETAGAVRGLMFAHFIGGSVASAVVNTTQPFMMTLPWLSQWGGPVKAAARLMASARLAVGGKIADKEMAAALARAEKDGIVSPQEIHHLTAEAMATWGKNPVLKRAAFLWGAPFSLAEQFNRRVTFLAAYQTAKAEGMADPFAFASEAVMETQGLYNKGNASNWARNPLGATALTFKQYSIHYLEWIKRMWNAGEPGSKERTEGRKAVLFAMALLFLAGGSEGLPFAEDLNDLADTVMQALGFDTSAKGWKREFIARTLGMGDTGADVVMRGLSAVPGIPLDVSMRMGMGNLLPGSGMLLKSNTDVSRDVLELAGPVGGLVNQYKDAGRKALDGNLGDAALGVLPTALQNVGKAASMWMNGEARDAKGRRIMETDELDAVMKLIGFQPADVARVQSRISEQDRRVRLARVVESSIADQWAQGLRERDVDMVNEARQQLADWNAANPDSRIAISSAQIKRRLKDLQSDKADRFARSSPKEMRGSVSEAIR